MSSEDDSLKALILFLEKLEQELNLKAFTLGKLNYWPLLRFQLNYCRKYGRFDYTSIYRPEETGVLGSLSLAVLLFRGYVSDLFSRLALQLSRTWLRLAWREYRKQTRRNERKKAEWAAERQKAGRFSKRDLVFFCSEKEHYLNIGGRRLAPLLDGMALGLGGDYSFGKLILSRKKKMHMHDWHFPAEEINHSPYVGYRFLNPLRAPKSFAVLRDALGILWDCNKLERALRRHGSPFRISSEELLYRMDMLQAESDAVYDVLKHIRPKAVFVTSYTGRSYVVLAARRLGIPVVDIQHGGMHRFNVACTHWYNVPESGYSLLPNWFWCWTPEVASMIESTVPAGHRAIVGGNPSYSIYASSGFSLDALLPQMIAKLNEAMPGGDGKKLILVALQYGKDAILPEHVLELYRETKDRWIWMFRLHPVGMDRKPELIGVLGEGMNPATIDIISDMPLPVLLARCDVILTKSSTIARECRDFRARPVFWSEKGAAIHSDLVESGNAGVALNKQDLVRAIESINATDGQSVEAMVQRHHALARNALANIVNRVQT